LSGFRDADDQVKVVLSPERHDTELAPASEDEQLDDLVLNHAQVLGMVSGHEFSPVKRDFCRISRKTGQHANSGVIRLELGTAGHTG